MIRSSDGPDVASDESAPLRSAPPGTIMTDFGTGRDHPDSGARPIQVWRTGSPAVPHDVRSWDEQTLGAVKDLRSEAWP